MGNKSRETAVRLPILKKVQYLTSDTVGVDELEPGTMLEADLLAQDLHIALLRLKADPSKENEVDCLVVAIHLYDDVYEIYDQYSFINLG